MKLSRTLYAWAVVWLLFAPFLIAGCMLGSCARRPQSSEPYEPQHQVRHTPDVGNIPQVGSSIPQTTGNIPQTAAPTLLRRLFPAAGARAAGNAAPKKGKQKCKGCTIVYGSVDNLSQAGKKATAATGTNASAAGAGAQQATDSATLTSAGTGNAATQQGDGNKLEQTATTQEAPDWKAALAGPTGKVLAFLGFCSAVYGIYWLVGWNRRRKQAQDLIS